MNDTSEDIYCKTKCKYWMQHWLRLMLAWTDLWIFCFDLPYILLAFSSLCYHGLQGKNDHPFTLTWASILNLYTLLVVSSCSSCLAAFLCDCYTWFHQAVKPQKEAQWPTTAFLRSFVVKLWHTCCSPADQSLTLGDNIILIEYNMPYSIRRSCICMWHVKWVVFIVLKLVERAWKKILIQMLCK